MATILAILGGLSAIITGFAYLVKVGVFTFSKTPAETDAGIDAQEEKNKQASEESGRPQ